MKLSPEVYPIISLEETHSTNLFLRQHCLQHPTEELTTICCNYQTAGRGQRGNSWEAEAGKNLLFSTLLLPYFLPARQQFFISQLISLSIKEELETYAKGFSIKWPNDIYYQEKKICGILIENDLSEGQLSQSIIGVGINVNQEFFQSNAPNPVSLKQIIGKEADRKELLTGILKRLSHYYQLLKEGETERIKQNYHHSLFRREGIHSFADQEGVFTARLQGVEPEGALLLTDETGRIRKYAFKEVSYLFISSSTR